MMAIWPTACPEEGSVTGEVKEPDVVGVNSHPDEVPSEHWDGLIAGKHEGAGRVPDREERDQHRHSVRPGVRHGVEGELVGEPRPGPLHLYDILDDMMQVHPQPPRQHGETRPPLRGGDLPRVRHELLDVDGLPGQEIRELGRDPGQGGGQRGTVWTRHVQLKAISLKQNIDKVCYKTQSME